MSWHFYVLISISLFTILNLLQRKLAINSQFPRAAAVLFTLIGGCISILYVLLSGELSHLKIPNQWYAWLFLILTCICYGLFERGRFFGAKYLEASVFNTLINVSLIVSFLFSIILYKESVSLEKVLGTVLILLGLLIVSVEKNIKHFLTKDVLLGLGIGTVLGLAWTLDKQVVSYFSPGLCTVFVWTLPTIVILFPKQKLSELKTEWKLGSWKIVLLALLNVFAYISQVKALEVADLSQVMPLIQTSVLLTVILSAVFLNERQRIVRKCFAAVFTVFGTFLIL